MTQNFPPMSLTAIVTARAALTALAAVLAVTAQSATAGGYGFDPARHANAIIQWAPQAPGADHGWYAPVKPWVKPWAKPVYRSYGHIYGHGVVDYGHGYTHNYTHDYTHRPVIKRTTIIKPVIVAPHPHAVYGHGYGHGYDQVIRHQTVTDLRGPILFASGSSHLTPEAKAELIEIGQIIKAHLQDPHVVIQLRGFTDAKGSKAANLALAKSRNHRVKDFLIESFGFAPERFSLRAVGEAYANGSDAPHAQGQRKVMVSLLGVPKPEHAAAVVPSWQPGHDPARAWGEHQGADQAAHQARARCHLPASPYGAGRVTGQVVARTFHDIDDYGSGQLIEYCALNR